jgi:hypothetical protein
MNITYRMLPALTSRYYQLHIVIVISHHLMISTICVLNLDQLLLRS